MNNKKAWAWSVVCFATFIAITTTAYVLIPDGSTLQHTNSSNSPYHMSATNEQ
ncbi:hypothetical protein SAMN05661091_0985 [Paenibacillus uliginis N3/975]|uniref:Uncharacterized protein n=1 Tax=Paenibacillus uliginis N3/975 TaxID=1313296 RepID=A0A1X7GRF3_9BACL|nr:hypothetical protein SAMN05661091_0985 [Paenibacillus uliginis N3/975]